MRNVGGFVEAEFFKFEKVERLPLKRRKFCQSGVQDGRFLLYSQAFDEVWVVACCTLHQLHLSGKLTPSAAALIACDGEQEYAQRAALWVESRWMFEQGNKAFLHHILRCGGILKDPARKTVEYIVVARPQQAEGVLVPTRRQLDALCLCIHVLGLARTFKKIPLR